MDFEVNGVTYLLTFNRNQGCWALLTPVEGGLRHVQVSDDESLPSLGMPKWEDFGAHEPVN